MKHILSRSHVGQLAALARSRALLAFDFDGTLAPIVADRDRAAMRPATLELLAAVAEHYPCAVISGRSRGDVTARLGSIGLKYVVGNHGGERDRNGDEPGPDLAAVERELEPMRRELAVSLAGCPGIELEDKRYSLSIHYRAARDRRAARIAIGRAIAALPRAIRVIRGKLVTNLVPLEAPNKGASLMELLERERAELALYIGDDVTDEDVFALRQPGKLLEIRVGKATGTAARFYLRDQREIDRLLAHLVELRRVAELPVAGP